MKKQFFISIMLLMHSVHSEAKQEWLTQMIEAKKESHTTISRTKNVAKGFFSNHALVLFYSSSCPHCHQFAPILKNWSLQHQAGVIALSFDNASLSEFPEFRPATTEWVNVAYAGRPISYPALFVVNKNTKALYPVTFGGLDGSELDNRMNHLILKIQSYEHQGVSA